MITKLCIHGDHLALMIDQPILDLLGIDQNTPLEVSIDGRTLIVSPAGDEQERERFQRALESTNKRFGETLKRLAE